MAGWDTPPTVDEARAAGWSTPPTADEIAAVDETARAQRMEEGARANEEARRRHVEGIVAEMNPAEAMVTAFGENARHAIRQGANLLGKVPVIGKHLDAPTDEQLAEEAENLKPLNKAVPLFAALGHGSISVAPMVAAAPAAIPAGTSVGKAALLSGLLGATQGGVFSDPGKRGTSAAIGGGLGLGTPLALAGAGAAARYAAGKVPEPIKEWLINTAGAGVDRLPEAVKAWLASKAPPPGALPPSSVPVEGPLKRGAESWAIRATGTDRTGARNAFGKPENVAKVSRTARLLLDEGIPLRSPRAMQEGLEDLMQTADGPEIGAMVKQASAAGATVDLGAAKARLLARPDIADLNTNSATRPVYERIVEFVDDQIKRHGPAMDPAAAFALRKGALTTLGKYNASAVAQEQIQAKAYQALRQELNASLDDAMAQTGLADKWAQTNARYAAAATAKKLADIGTERASRNKFVSLTEGMAGGSGLAASLATGNVAPAAGAAALIALNRYGPVTVARTLDALSRTAGPATSGAAQNVPAVRAIAPSLEDLAAFLSRRGLRLGAAPAGDEDPASRSTQH